MNNKLLSCAMLVNLGILGGCTSRPKPNIVFILADDMGYGDVSCLDDSCKIRTVNIDALARDGVILTDAHSSSSVSTPTRYGLMTGRYNWRSTLKRGVINGYGRPLIPQGRRTIGSMLQQEGYYTAAIGKWHLGWEWNGIEKGTDSVDFTRPVANGPVTRGFDYFYGIAGSLDMIPYVYVENDMPTALPDRITGNAEKYTWWRKGPTASDFDHQQVLPNLTERACRLIGERAPSDQPYFLYLPLPAPHTPILPAPEFQGKTGLGPYGDYVLMVDAMVGKVLEAVRASGEEDNTIVVFATDNGCSREADFEDLAKHGHYPSSIYRGSKSDLWDGGHRIPCIVRWPARFKPHVVRQTVCLTDFYATFAAIAGHEMQDNEGEDSYDILPALLSEKEIAPIREATVHHSIVGEFTIRKGKWKLLFSGSSGGWTYPAAKDVNSYKDLPPMQLYDMEADPSETTNLVHDHPEVVRELKELLLKYIEDGRSTPGIPQSNDPVQSWPQLRALKSL